MSIAITVLNGAVGGITLYIALVIWILLNQRRAMVKNNLGRLPELLCRIVCWLSYILFKLVGLFVA
jgi:hypothetical protein